MAGQFEATTEVERPIKEVFDYLAEGTNDPEFSPRVQHIEKVTDGPVGVGTVFASRVIDAGMQSSREFRITEFEAPTKIRWTEISTSPVTSTEGGYDLTALSETTTRVRIYNVLEGHGVGKFVTGMALKAAQKDAPAFGNRIKRAVEAAD